MVDEKDKKKPEIRKWHTQHEVILKNWGECCACYRYLHYKAFQKYKKSSMRFTLPIIIISTITGTANFAQETFPLSWQSYVPSGIGALNLIAAIMTTVSQFLKLSEMLESHRSSSIHYGKLSRTIRLELSLPITERTQDGTTMVEMCRAEYDRLIEQSPTIPKEILEKFEKTFKLKHTQTAANFSTPEILSVKPIEPFNNVKAAQTINEKVQDIFMQRRSGGEVQMQPVDPPIQAKDTVIDVLPRVNTMKKNMIRELESLKNKRLVTKKIDEEELFLECENEIFAHEFIQTPTNSEKSHNDNDQQCQEDEVKTETSE